MICTPNEWLSATEHTKKPIFQMLNVWRNNSTLNMWIIELSLSEWSQGERFISGYIARGCRRTWRLLRGFPGWSSDAIFTPVLPVGLRLSGAAQCCCWSTTRNRRAADNPPFAPGRHEQSQYPSTMAERENLVYQAKLAEQAERYDGKAPNN